MPTKRLVTTSTCPRVATVEPVTVVTLTPELAQLARGILRAHDHVRTSKVDRFVHSKCMACDGWSARLCIAGLCPTCAKLVPALRAALVGLP